MLGAREQLPQMRSEGEYVSRLCLAFCAVPNSLMPVVFMSTAACPTILSPIHDPRGLMEYSLGKNQVQLT